MIKRMHNNAFQRIPKCSLHNEISHVQRIDMCSIACSFLYACAALIFFVFIKKIKSNQLYTHPQLVILIEIICSSKNRRKQ